MTFLDYMYYRIYQFYTHTLKESYDVEFAAALVLSVIYGFNISVVYRIIDMLVPIELPDSLYIELSFALAFMLFNSYYYLKVKNIEKIRKEIEKHPVNKSWSIGATIYFTASILLFFLL